jgi:hypothetical protein
MHLLNLSDLKAAFKYIFLTCGIVVVAGFIFWIIVLLSFSGAFDKHVTRQEAVANFSIHESEIMYFSDLFLSKRPIEHEVFIFINGNKGKLSIGISSWAIDQRFPNQNLDFKVSSIDDHTAFLKELGWDVQMFKKIVAAFRKTNCESAMTNDGNVSLRFKTGTWSSFGYHVKALPIDDSTKRKFEADGIQLLNNRVTLGSAAAL